MINGGDKSRETISFPVYIQIFPPVFLVVVVLGCRGGSGVFVVLINVWRRGELCQISFNNNQSEMGLRGLGGGPRSMKFFGDSSQKYFNIKSNV